MAKKNDNRLAPSERKSLAASVVSTATLAALWVAFAWLWPYGLVFLAAAMTANSLYRWAIYQHGLQQGPPGRLMRRLRFLKRYNLITMGAMFLVIFSFAAHSQALLRAALCLCVVLALVATIDCVPDKRWNLERPGAGYTFAGQVAWLAACVASAFIAFSRPML